jgi:hypothetical protein
MTFEAFAPFTNCFALDVTAASQTIAVAIPVANNTAVQVQYQFTVVGSVPVFINFGAAGTVPVAAIPATGTDAAGIMFPAGACLVLSFAPGTVIAAIAAGAGSTLYVNAGYGV